MKDQDKRKITRLSKSFRTLVNGDLESLEPTSPQDMHSTVGGTTSRSKSVIPIARIQASPPTSETPATPDYHAEAETALTEKDYVHAAEDFEKAGTKHDELDAGNAWNQAAIEAANKEGWQSNDAQVDSHNASNDWHSGIDAYKQAAESATNLTQAARDYEGEGNGFVDFSDGADALKAYKEAVSDLENTSNATVADHQNAFDIESKIIAISQTHGNGLSDNDISRHDTKADALDAQATILSIEGGEANLSQAGALFEQAAKALGGDLLTADSTLLANTVEYDKAGQAWSAAAREAVDNDKGQDFANAALDFRSAGDLQNEATAISLANSNGYQGFITEATTLEQAAPARTDQEKQLLGDIASQQQALANFDNNSLSHGQSWESGHQLYENLIAADQNRLTALENANSLNRADLKTEAADYEQAAMDLQGVAGQGDHVELLHNHVGDIFKQLAQVDKANYDAATQLSLQDAPYALIRNAAILEASDADKAAQAYNKAGDTLAQANMLQVEKDALTAYGQDAQTEGQAANEVGQTAGALYLQMAKAATNQADQLTLYQDAEKALENTFDRADLAKADRHIGLIEEAQGHYDKAGKAFSDAGSEDVTYAQATSDFENSGKSYNEAGKYGHAAAAYSNAGSVDLANGDYVSAVTDFEKAGTVLKATIQAESGLTNGEQVSAYQAEANAYQNAGAINANLGHNAAAAADFQNALTAVNAARSIENAEVETLANNWMANHGGGESAFDQAMNAAAGGLNDAIHDTADYVATHEWAQMVIATAAGVGAGMLAAPYIAVAGLAVGGAVAAGVDAGADVLARTALESGIVIVTSPAAESAAAASTDDTAQQVENAILRAAGITTDTPVDIAISDSRNPLATMLEDAVKTRISQFIANRPRIEVKAAIELAFQTREDNEVDKILNTALSGSLTMASLDSAIALTSLAAEKDAQQNETARAAADSMVANTLNNLSQTATNSTIASLSQDYVNLGTDGRLSNLQSDLTDLPSNLEKAGVHSNMAKALEEESSLLTQEIDVAQAQSAKDLAVANSDKTVAAKVTAQGDSADGNLNVAEAQKLFNAEGDTSDG
ncbi:MAG: hypothetical protein K2W95_05925 [Candidatus Obscuribacterales bacterium]|nr:hypothetical protein [Candidatus Obscuribacterales bacterium]